MASRFAMIICIGCIVRIICLMIITRFILSAISCGFMRRKYVVVPVAFFFFWGGGGVRERLHARYLEASS